MSAADDFPEGVGRKSPDMASIRLRFHDEHVDITRFTRYSFASDWLTDVDGWSFTVADEDLPEAQRNAMKVGAEVSFYINRVKVASGHIMNIEVDADKNGGTSWSINGRDPLGLALDATMDPTVRFKDGATLGDILKQIFAPFGWLGDDDFQIDNSANRNASTGGDRGAKYSHGKKHFGQPLKKYVAHALKPYNHESVLKFASRVTQRFGLWIWCSGDGDTLIVGKPDFTQSPTFRLSRTRMGGGNVISGRVSWSGEDQPSIIVADGFSGGGEYGKGRIKVFCVNPVYGVDADGFVLDSVSEIINSVPDAFQVTLTTVPMKRRVAKTPPRPMFLHDDESKTREQLENFVRREMALKLQKSLTCSYRVDGHGQMVDGTFVAWDIDTVVTVDDDVADLHENMWVLGLNYEQDARGGTFTTLHLIRLNSIQLGDPIEQAVAKPAPFTILKQKNYSLLSEYHTGPGTTTDTSLVKPKPIIVIRKGEGKPSGGT